MDFLLFELQVISHDIVVKPKLCIAISRCQHYSQCFKLVADFKTHNIPVSGFDQLHSNEGPVFTHTTGSQDLTTGI